MGRRIVFTSQKGGVGKSTLARSTAVALAGTGRRVLLADFDPDQGTCTRWRDQRRARSLGPTVDVASFEKAGKLDRAAGAYDDVVIDTPGRLNRLAVELAKTADAVFLPASFSLDDILPTLRVIEALRDAGARADRLAVVFCRTGGSRAQETQARSILDMNGVAALGASLPQKDGYVSLYATGRTGAEASNPFLRDAASHVERALADFIEDVAPAKKAA